MLDVIKTKKQFQSLNSESKYEQLLKTFVDIKDANENCKYIYEKLTNEPSLFDDELMDTVFDDVLKIYQRIEKDKGTKNTNLISSMSNTLQMIHDAETRKSQEDTASAEALLHNL